LNKLFSAEPPSVSLKLGMISTTLLLFAVTKLHIIMRFRLVPKQATFERPLRLWAYTTKHASLGAQHEYSNEEQTHNV